MCIHDHSLALEKLVVMQMLFKLLLALEVLEASVVAAVNQLIVWQSLSFAVKPSAKAAGVSVLLKALIAKVVGARICNYADVNRIGTNWTAFGLFCTALWIKLGNDGRTRTTGC